MHRNNCHKFDTAIETKLLKTEWQQLWFFIREVCGFELLKKVLNYHEYTNNKTTFIRVFLVQKFLGANARLEISAKSGNILRSKAGMCNLCEAGTTFVKMRPLPVRDFCKK